MGRGEFRFEKAECGMKNANLIFEMGHLKFAIPSEARRCHD
jgi:hypothetical protein